jgi:hypothetical protein
VDAHLLRSGIENHHHHPLLLVTLLALVLTYYLACNLNRRGKLPVLQPMDADLDERGLPFPGKVVDGVHTVEYQRM